MITTISKLAGGRRFQNGLLSVIALALLAMLVSGRGPTPADAQVGSATRERLAQPARPVPADPAAGIPFNAGEQRRQMLQELQLLNRRLSAIESRLRGELVVRVSDEKKGSR